MKGTNLFMLHVKVSLIISALLIAICAGAWAVQQASVITIADIGPAHIDKEVSVTMAEVMKSEIRPLWGSGTGPGMRRYAYEISDGTGRIVVFSDNYPPGVGTLVDVSGIVINDPSDAAVLNLDETKRLESGQGTVKKYLFAGIGILLGFIVLLIVLIVRQKEPPPVVLSVRSEWEEISRSPDRMSVTTGLLSPLPPPLPDIPQSRQPLADVRGIGQAEASGLRVEPPASEEKNE